MTKLTPEDVGLIVAMVDDRDARVSRLRAEIKALQSEIEHRKFELRRETALTYKAIGAKFDVSASCIEHVVSGEAWPQGGTA